MSPTSYGKARVCASPHSQETPQMPRMDRDSKVTIVAPKEWQETTCGFYFCDLVGGSVAVEEAASVFE